MKLVCLSYCVSPHQFPLAKELAHLIGDENFRNIYDHPMGQFRVAMGWNPDLTEPWELIRSEHSELCGQFLLEADVLMCGYRDISLFEQRAALGKTTIYCAERWFKPLWKNVRYSGWLRLLVPQYFLRVCKFMRIMRTSQQFKCYPMGVHARNELLVLARLFGIQNAVQRIVTWGYSVTPGRSSCRNKDDEIIRVMWAGRLIGWKRCKDVIGAIKKVLKQSKTKQIVLDIYGDGPLRGRLEQLAKGIAEIRFMGNVANSKIREEMRTHDVYVLSSDYNEGWGAVVSEALEEGMTVLGTYEAGASATILPETNLYHAGDIKRLSKLLANPPPPTGIGIWSSKAMAERLLADLKVDLK